MVRERVAILPLFPDRMKAFERYLLSQYTFLFRLLQVKVVLDHLHIGANFEFFATVANVFINAMNDAAENVTMLKVGKSKLGAAIGAKLTKLTPFLR